MDEATRCRALEARHGCPSQRKDRPTAGSDRDVAVARGPNAIRGLVVAVTIGHSKRHETAVIGVHDLEGGSFSSQLPDKAWPAITSESKRHHQQTTVSKLIPPGHRQFRRRSSNHDTIEWLCRRTAE